MPPITTSKIEGKSRYSIPFLGSIEERLSEKLDISSLIGTDNVDADGLLIPGVVLRRDSADGLLKAISGAEQTARGLVLEAVKVAKSNSTADLNAANDFDVVIVVAGTVDRAIAEFNLDREYTENELAAIDASAKFTLTEPES